MTVVMTDETQDLSDDFIFEQLKGLIEEQGNVIN